MPQITQAIDFDRLEGATGLRFASKNLGDIISSLLPYLFTAAGLLLLLFLIYGGISLMLSRGDPKAVQAARDKITGALIGFIIIFAAYWLVQLIGRILGITAIQTMFR